MDSGLCEACDAYTDALETCECCLIACCPACLVKLSAHAVDCDRRDFPAPPEAA